MIVALEEPSTLGVTLTWVGIALCLLHSAMFSGLNLALFSLSRMHLEIEAEQGSAAAKKVLELRTDANFLLTTILWGNVAVNTLLTLLMDSVLAGVAAFAVSTFGITFVGEIIPQAYFSRHAMAMGSLLAPVLKFYKFVLWPVARPSAKLLDLWLGPDGVHYLRETHCVRVCVRVCVPGGLLPRNRFAMTLCLVDASSVANPPPARCSYDSSSRSTTRPPPID